MRYNEPTENYYQPFSAAAYYEKQRPKEKPTMRVERKTTLQLGGTSVKVGELREILQEFPADATLVVSYMAGDPRDQRESSSATFTINLPKP